ncbi:lipopolysaccharide biosynthesis protein [Burkholderia sp. LMU1-1-1.1]|uniref:lipopolysaccharide biosynthesis protein n=1 Tax=Burkholderia sp. LMU1-1-1.1 TaxID=3135266 RepID=UPI0034424DCC
MNAIKSSLLMSFAEKYTVLVIGMAGGMVIARLLTPGQIGIFSIGAVVVGITQMVRDFGIGQYLIQEKDLNTERLRAAYTLTMLISWSMAALLALAGDPVAAFYDEPGVGEVLRVLALNVLLIPFGSITLPVLRRQLRFRALYWINVANALTNLVVCLVLIKLGFGYLSLAWAAVAGSLVTVLASLPFRPADMPWLPGFTGMRKLLRFGAYATGSNVIDECGVAAPDMIIGKLIDVEAVGLFGKAQATLNIFNMLITRAVTPVILPLFAANVRDGHDVKRLYLRTIAYMAGLAWPFFAVLAVLATPLTRLLYGPQWDASAPLVRVMCVSSATFCLFSMARDLFVAMGQVRLRAQLEAIGVSVRIAGIVVAAPFGLEAVAWSIAATSLLRSALLYRSLAALTGMRLAELGRGVARSAALTALTVAGPALTMLSPGLDDASPVVLLALAGSASLLCWLAGIVLLNHEIKPDLMATTRPLLRRLLPKPARR